MTDNRENNTDRIASIEEDTKIELSQDKKEQIEKDVVPHFFPTYRVKSEYYAVPIIIAVVCAGFLAFLTHTIAGIQLDGGYISEAEYGPAAGLINGIIFTVMAVASAFIIIFIAKRKGLDFLKYLFGFSIAFLSFFLSLFFGEIVLYLIYRNFPETEILLLAYNINYYVMLIILIIYSLALVYKYLTSTSIKLKNFVILYVSLLTGAMLGVIMPLWTTLAILIGISIWDIFAVLYKRGPIKQMIDLASEGDEEIQQKIESGEAEYDTSKLEIGIGDLAFYSMLTSAALVLSGNLLVMIFTAIAILIGTGITIQGLKKNKLLPGLPISIFLGIGTMLLSWFIITLL
ncbi:MAG: hypothetical protein GF317_08560 [Candidatus Lokiarchaeota archaeon]|nr:hypothetical protein [Candidatus Lokiarchaeota archaeon]MBD3199766.1 hypothetical protein [Candidatus Lokiarchaeota archaeon]